VEHTSRSSSVAVLSTRASVYFNLAALVKNKLDPDAPRG
jgi:hypothetical protein